MQQIARGELTFEVHCGGPPEGEPVLLLHGFPQDHTCWDAVLPRLHAAGLRTIAPDQRGYSPRARPERRRAYRGEQLVDDVIAILDALNVEQAHVAGHDWGGAVAWGLADRRPDRVRSLTVLSMPHPSALLGALTSSSQALRAWEIAVMQLPGLPDRLLGSGRAARALERVGLPPAQASHYAHRLAEPGAARGALNWYRGLPFTLGHSFSMCRVPATYVWGCRDPFISRRAAERTARYVTGAFRFVELDAGHWLPETEPACIAGLIGERIRSTRSAWPGRRWARSVRVGPMTVR